MRGWPNEPHRHALASRGICTRAIPNPIADPSLYDIEWYRRKGEKDSRKFVGSGLEGIDKFDVLDELRTYIREVDGTKEIEEGYIRDYYNFLAGLTRDMREMPYEEFEKFFDDVVSEERFLEIEAIYLTGSRVTGFYIPESDIDVYIQIKKPKLKTKLDMDYLLEKIMDAVDNYLSDEGIEMKVYDRSTKKDVKVDVNKISPDPPDVSAIVIHEGGFW